MFRLLSSLITIKKKFHYRKMGKKGIIFDFDIPCIYPPGENGLPDLGKSYFIVQNQKDPNRQVK